MTDFADKALLPAGMTDVLPPDAAFEAEVLEALMAAYASRGYARIKPPLIEFEESLLAGLGTAMTAQTFRVMDPVSQRMMGVRADMTPQVARIAATRLADAPRPLRLSYAGQVLRVKGSQLRPERQFAQVGAELIGAAEPEADAEVILMATTVLEKLGVTGLSVDIAMPTLVPAVCNEFGISDPTQVELRRVLDRKDAAGVAGLANELGGPAAEILSAMLTASGPADETLASLGQLKLGNAAEKERLALAAVADILKSRAPELSITIDPVENRGFEYHTGVTYTFYARDVRGELGSGGRYLAENSNGGEPATGFTLFMDTVLRALPRPQPSSRVYVPAGTAEDQSKAFRAEGWMTVQGLAPVSDNLSEAHRLECTHLLEDGAIRELNSQDKG